MKQVTKWIATFLSALFCVFTAVSCAPVPFEWKETPPETVPVGEELIFRDYLSVEEGATYTLYVSYQNPVTEKAVENEKQSSLIYSLDYATVYTFKIERLLDKKTATLEATVEALPKAPAFTSATQLQANVGETKTFDEIFALSGSFVTPSDLSGKVKFESVKIEKATYSATNDEDALVETQTIAADATGYTFAYGAVYTFTASAENKSGKAELEIVVSTVDEVKMAAKTEISFEALTSTLTWTAVEGATGYRVTYNGQKVNVTDGTTYVLPDSLENGEYEVGVAPIYGDEIYASSFATRMVSIGAVKTPLALTRENYKISWTARDFAVNYTVTENGTAYTVAAENTSYTLQGSYNTHDKVTVEVVANLNYKGETSVSETASVEFTYGTVFFKALDATATANEWKAVDGIEFVEIGDGLDGNTWVMVEFKGKNAPNVAVRATQGFTSVSNSGGQNAYWSNAGIMLMNSTVGEKTERLYVTRGFFSDNSGLCTIDARGYIAQNAATDIAPGIRNLDDNTNYVMILGYEHHPLTAEETSNGKENPNNCRITAIYYSVDEQGNLTEVFKAEKNVTVWHALTGAKTILYPNVASNENSTGVTFTYYPAATTLADVVNNSTSPNKAALKALLSV